MASDLGFRQRLWDNYCHVTSFHGFRELNMYHNWYNRLFWIISIVGGFAFTASLMVLGIQAQVEDPVRTLTTFNQSGILDITVMYCPERFISSAKAENFSEEQMYFATSFLWDVGASYTEPLYPLFMNGINNTINRPYVFRGLITSVVRENVIPSYYSPSAAFVMGMLFKFDSYTMGSVEERHMQSRPVPTMFSEFYTRLYQMYACNETALLFETVYKYLLMDEKNEIIKYRYRRIVDEYTKMSKFQDKFDWFSLGCFTLTALDRLDNMTGLDEQQFREAIVNETNCDVIFKAYDRLTKLSTSCNLSEEHFQLEFIVDTMFNERMYEDTRSNELLRAKEVFQLLLQEGQISPSGLGYKTDRRALVESLLRNQSQPGLKTLERLVKKAEKRFLENKKRTFKEFLKRNGFTTVFDFLKAIAYDAEDFLVWITTSPFKGSYLPPDHSRVVVEKVFAGQGLCYQFHVTATPEHHDDLALPRYKRVHTYYVNIVHLADYPELGEEWPYYGFLALGDSVNDLVPGDYENLHDFITGTVLQDETWNSGQVAEDIFIVNGSLFDHPSIKMSSAEIQIHQNRRGSPCRETSQSDDKVYTYNNCVAKCRYFYHQPKAVWVAPDDSGGFPIGICYYETIGLPDSVVQPTIKNCSYFNIMKQVWENWERHPSLYPINLRAEGSYGRLIDDSMYDMVALNKCAEACLHPCVQPTRTFTYSQKHSGPDYYKTLLLDTVCVRKGWSNETRSDGQPRSLPCREQIQTTYPNYPNITDNDLLLFMCDKNNCRNRMELEVQTNSILYQEKFTFTWFDMFGLVGGQMGLVMGASCLTLLQLIWVAAKTINDVRDRRQARREYRRNLSQSSAPQHVVASIKTIPLFQNETKVAEYLCRGLTPLTQEVDQLKQELELERLKIQKLEEALEHMLVPSTTTRL